jgi:deoxycytidylate deaminase
VAGGGVYGEGHDIPDLDGRCAYYQAAHCRNTAEQNKIIGEIVDVLVSEIPQLSSYSRAELGTRLRSSGIGGLLEFSRAVHAEMDALLTASRKGISSVGTRMWVTTFPCHYCARHIVSAGVDEVHFIEPYPKSKALDLHPDSVTLEPKDWNPPSKGGNKTLFRPFTGVAPTLYRRAFLKDRELKDSRSGNMLIGEANWGSPWHLKRISYVEIEAELAKD